MSKYKENRIRAIEWWNSLGLIFRARSFLIYKETNFTPAQKPSELTGREIEVIFKNKIINE